MTPKEELRELLKDIHEHVLRRRAILSSDVELAFSLLEKLEEKPPTITSIVCDCGHWNPIDMKSQLWFQTIMCPQCGRRTWVRIRPNQPNERPLDLHCPIGEAIYEFEVEKDWREKK